jgi:tRNA G10  N-methylase Trm11
MYTTVVIPGKNWLLSLAELAAFFEVKKCKFQIESFSKEFFIVQFEKKIKPSLIDDLGGVIKIGEINTSFQTDVLKRAILDKDKTSKNEIGNIISDTTRIVDDLISSEKKTFFGVSIYCSEKRFRKIAKAIQRFFGSLIKKKLSEQGKKSRFMGFSKDRRRPQLSHVEVLKKRLIESNGEFIISIDGHQTWLSTTKSVHNPFEFQKRDIEKPIQRKIFAMPPRLARILVNLSLCDQKSILLDPFCGVGSILQEGLLNRSKVIGVDINPWCIKASERNLEWLSNNYQIDKPDFRVIQGDIQELSKKIGYEEIDCVATEPDLGPALRQIPTDPYAQKIINKLDRLYSFFLQESYKVLKKNCRCVFVTPYLKTRSGKAITMNIDEKAKKLGFTRVFPLNKEIFGKTIIKKEEMWKIASLTDVNKRHKTGREIHILQK